MRKSGRVQLILGQVTLDVSLGTTCSFLQVWYLWGFFQVFVRDVEETYPRTSRVFHSFFTVLHRSWSLSVPREERDTSLFWAISNTRLFVPQILRLCWREVLDSFYEVEKI